MKKNLMIVKNIQSHGIIIATADLSGTLVIVLIYNDDRNDYVTNSPMVSDTNIKIIKIAEINDVGLQIQ